MKTGIQEYEKEMAEKQAELKGGMGWAQQPSDDTVSASKDAMAKYKRPWWGCQPHIRALPEEALRTGALKPSRKELARAAVEKEATSISITSDDGLEPNEIRTSEMRPEIPRPALVCG